VRILPAGVLVLEKLSELLGQPLQIGKGGLREGIILDLLNNGASNGKPAALAA
jgi:exopolyphosphatase/guanosine-5'-triphosphate,3'-diphosphate pyrophosphatase